MGTEYQTNEFPLDKVKIICDTCLDICDVKRAGTRYACAFAVACKCGRQEMVGANYKFTVLSPQGKVLLSSVLEPSSRRPGQYERNEPDKNRLFIELDTGQVIEDAADVDLFVWGIDHGAKPYDALEDQATRLMKLYERFKNSPQPGHEPPPPKGKRKSKSYE